MVNVDVNRERMESIFLIFIHSKQLLHFGWLNWNQRVEYKKKKDELTQGAGGGEVGGWSKEKKQKFLSRMKWNLI